MPANSSSDRILRLQHVEVRVPDLELATAEWVDWYNHRRLHGELGLVPPVEYEDNHALTQPVRQPASG